MSAQGYVVGFAVDPAADEVLLIRKNRPTWQAGLLNGIGGHVEPGEDDEQAMVREFQEETGVLLGVWRPMLRMEFPGAYIAFYRAHVSGLRRLGACSLTDEEVLVRGIGGLLTRPDAPVIPNLRWLLPLAAYTADEYELMRVRAHVAGALTAAGGEDTPGAER